MAAVREGRFEQVARLAPEAPPELVAIIERALAPWPEGCYANARELVEVSEPETMAVRLAHLPVPVTYVAGAPDGACARSRELLDGAGVATIEIAPAGHWPFIDQPGVFAGAVATLL